MLIALHNVARVVGVGGNDRSATMCVSVTAGNHHYDERDPAHAT